jgi:transcriptional regulator with XRE-family HTH domain
LLRSEQQSKTTRCQQKIANVEFPQDWIVPLGGRHADEVAVSNWLSGRNEPTLRNLLRLSTALRTDPAELLTDESGSTTR